MKNIVDYLYKNSEEKEDKIFCVDNFGTFTYKEAVDSVERIATFLHKQNIVNSPIIFNAERNNKSLIILLGIILSGNYFVPVNVDLSEEKIDSIIASSNAKFQIITDNNAHKNLTIFNYDEMLNCLPDKGALKEIKINLDDKICTIFTSGSTGKPKGVMKTHRNFASFVENFIETFNFNDDLRIANQAPLFFDASMKDVFLTIALGATIYFPDKTLFSMPLKLIEYLNENKINYVCWVPSALTIIVKLNTFKYLKPTHLQYVMFVGEVFLPKYLNIWLRELPDIMYVNLYGSTEIAGVCLYKIINRELDEQKPIPLGVPIKNNKVYIDGEEILVESDQIALGYINDEAKNKEVFEVKNGIKILHTGDFGFLNEDGDIVFTSRKDFQIKHMGYRIELQEIDIAVSSLKCINNCAVLYDKRADKIVAFVSLNNTLQSPVKEIITDLKNILPPYMLPNRVEILDDLPLNANGKIDRNKLKQIIGE